MKDNLVLKGLSCICDGLVSFADFLRRSDYDNEVVEEGNMNVAVYNGIPDKSVRFSKKVLDEFRGDVGRFRAETGGMLASMVNEQVIDKCYFDTHSQNTPGTFYYDVESMSAVFRAWKAAGYITNGIYHSHPRGVTQPSYHDISSALLHIDFFSLEYFYLPIIQPNHEGLYTMYFYIVKKALNNLEVSLSYVIEALQNGYRYAPFRAWKRIYSIRQLYSYRESIDRSAVSARVKMDDMIARRSFVVPQIGMESDASLKAPEISIQKNVTTIVKEDCFKMTNNQTTPEKSEVQIQARDYFKKVADLYPDKVLEKVIVCVGTGGARSFLENCARSGFRNYVLIDADVVSPSNVATQGVFISEMGKKKVEVIRDRIKDINPNATVVCVDKFLDNSMSDEEFKGYMDQFPEKKPTDYLILGCTDNFEAQKRSSLLALKYGTPYLAAMMYEDGAAAEIIFIYPGVTESCPRCLLRDRFEKYENGFVNDVDSSSCPIFATERMNALKGYIALMLLMYKEDPKSPLSRMLDDVKDRNFVEIRLNPHLKESKLGIDLFDRVFADASRYVYFDETLWVPQHPDRPEFGADPCKLCGGTGDLGVLQTKWKTVDTRNICFEAMTESKSVTQMKLERMTAGLDGISIAINPFEAKI